ncbi:hypothetical protein [Paenibacillus herberti]|uniref:hypothetical protein n=1 Tax=Paenibacillus herberti TaxID=1619309 RepID=UPI0015963494|nr:hypothetical protein [Paenibacillus herberti]
MMKLKLLEITICIALGFFTGVWLSGGGIHLQESANQIILSSIFFLLALMYLKADRKK